MAGFLETLFGSPEQTQALGLLGSYLMAGRPAEGFQAASGLLAEAPMRQKKMTLLDAQIAETLAQADERKTIAAQRQAEAERLAGIQRGLPGLFTKPGMTGGAAVPQTFSGSDVPMFSAPMGVTPMRSTPGGFDMQQALNLRMKPEEAKAYWELSQLGRPKVARTMEVMRNGKPTMIQLDESGQEIGQGYDQWKAPVMQGLGDRTLAIDPVSLQPRGSFPMGQSPDSKASNALGWANNALTRRGQDMADARAREANSAGKVPAGYRLAANGQGLEYIPGGPADPNAAKKAAPTEFQGKAAMFGDRAAEAHRIISSLEGKYSPAMLNAKTALGSVWGVGGGLEAAGNLMLPDNAQKVEQAQRDFVNAVLRLESGAAIANTEFDNAKKQYFPQPGDSAAVIEQKRANRERAINGLKSNARTSGAAAPGPSLAGDENDPLGLRK